MAFHQVDEYVWWRLSLSSLVGKWDRPSAFQAPELSERRTWQQKSEQSLPWHRGYQGDLRKQFWKLSGVSSLPLSETLCKVLSISFLVLKLPMFQLFPALTKLREQYRYKCRGKIWQQEKFTELIFNCFGKTAWSTPSGLESNQLLSREWATVSWWVWFRNLLYGL